MRRLLPLLTSSILLLFSPVSAYAIRPGMTYDMTPNGVGLQYDSVNIRTKDGFRLTGWYCSASAASSTNPVVILAGGDAGNMSNDLPLAAFIAQNFGLRVLLFDYRGFGTSQPFKFDTNAIGHPEYLKDLDAAVNFVLAQNKTSQVVVYGRSLGASLALVEGSQRSDISGVIAESPYVTQAMLAQHLIDRSANPTGVVIAPVASSDLEPLEHIKEFKSKNLLVMHGMLEKFILTTEVADMVQLAPIQNKKYLAFDNCDHLEIPMRYPQQLGDALESFFKSCN